jgi:hypothetical protein
MHGDFHTIMQGAPLLLVGLWWAGRELGRSMMAGRARRSRQPHQLGKNADISHP